MESLVANIDFDFSEPLRILPTNIIWLLINSETISCTPHKNDSKALFYLNNI